MRCGVRSGLISGPCGGSGRGGGEEEIAGDEGVGGGGVGLEGPGTVERARKGRGTGRERGERDRWERRRRGNMMEIVAVDREVVGMDRGGRGWQERWKKE